MVGPVIVDTNLLLLLVVGAADRRYISLHKRLAGHYTVEDFDQVSQIAAAFSDVLVLPNTLTEVSNLARHIPGEARGRVQRTFRAFVESATEVYVPSRAGALRDEFVALGLTDAVILHLCAVTIDDGAPTLLSVDDDLINGATALGYGCIDYKLLR